MSVCCQIKEEQQTEWRCYTFAADGSWAQSGQTAKCRVRYKPNASEPRTRIRGAVKPERQFIASSMKVTNCQSLEAQSETAKLVQSGTMKQESRRGVHVIYLCKCVDLPEYQDAWMLRLGAALRQKIKHCNICRLLCADAKTVKTA